MLGTLWSGLDSSLLDNYRRVENELEQLFGRSTYPAGIRAAPRGTYPPINVGMTPERVDVYVFVAGIDPASIDVSVQQNVLAIGGQRKVAVQAEADYYRRERFDGDFHRVIALPQDADPNRVEAKYRDGVLHITVQRREPARPRQVQIN